MQNSFSEVYLSELDEKRFGIKVAKAMNITAAKLPHIMKYCSDNDVSLLIARCKTTEIISVQEMEKEGFILMDTLVYYNRDIQNKLIPQDEEKKRIRILGQGEEKRVREIAAGAFRDYFGHYHMDTRLSRQACDDIYTDWAYRTCVSKNVADLVLVAELNNIIVGFMALKVNGRYECEVILNAVLPEAQRKGIYRSMMIEGMRYFKSQGVKNIIVSTQIMNIAAQKVWTRLGFELIQSYYTFHKWYSRLYIHDMH